MGWAADWRHTYVLIRQTVSLMMYYIGDPQPTHALAHTQDTTRTTKEKNVRNKIM